MEDNILAYKGDYQLKIVTSKETELLTYQIFNNITLVAEVETTILPQAYKFLEELSAALDAIKDISEGTTITGYSDDNS